MALPAIKLYEHITVDEKGVPVVEGTATRVIDLVLTQRAHGMSPEELCFQLPHLTMGQVHSALAYYWDHKEELDAEIRWRYEAMESLQAEVGPSPLVQRLEARGLI